MLAEVRALAYRLVPRYNAAVYSEIGNWRHGFDDLIQDVITDSLLRDHQAQYMLDVSATIDDFHRLLARQIRRTLARRRTRTVVDNLLARAREILVEPEFDRLARHQVVTFRLRDGVVQDRAATFPELRHAAQVFRRLPTVGSSGRDRAPVVLRTKDLRTGLRHFAAALPVAFTIGELDHAFRLALPQFLPGVLDLYEPHEADGEEINSDVVESTARELLIGLDAKRRCVLAMKLAGSADAEIAVALGVSRRTAGNRKNETFAVVSDLLSSLHHGERKAVLDRVSPELREAILSRAR